MEKNKQDTIKIALDAWHSRVKLADKLLSELTDEQLLKEVAPNKERGIYLLGQMVSINDSMFTLFNLCSPIFPDLKRIFLDNPDKAIVEIPSVEEIRQNWVNVHIQLAKQFAIMRPNEWYQKPAVEQDISKDSQASKFYILISKTNDLSYHLGQLSLLKN